MTGAPLRASRVRVRAQAKLNLHLRVLARETSGFHAVETVMHKVALADDVEVRLEPTGIQSVECDVDVGPSAHNLAYRAGRAYLAATEAATGWTTGFAIRITKRIPAGGGLGGGSADAGATLRALNALAPTPLSSRHLLSLAASLGADVPFLTSDATMALAWGRGERMLALDPLPERHVVLVVPPFSISTADAYGWLASDRTSLQQHPGEAADAVELRSWHLANWPELSAWRTNDFERVIATRHPGTSTILGQLHGAGAAMAGMTGSGSTFFGIFDVLPPPDALESVTGGTRIVTKTADGVEAVQRID